MIKIILKLIPKFFKKKITNFIDKQYLFVGWNLKTKTCPPWKNTIPKNNIFQINYFNNLNENLINEIKTKKFLLNQKINENTEKIYEYRWRHYNICLSLKYLKNFKKKINLVEAGTADGLSAWFVCNFLKKEKIKYDKFTLIDSWEPMDKFFLKPSEYSQILRYKNNSLEVTKKNLQKFKKITFLKGFIPKVFKKYKDQKKIDWLHIDLNSSIATQATLDFFSKKLNKNSVVLFDDYLWPNHEDSRIQIDLWSKKRKGILWPIPTGQAIFFNF